eukprot:TRINITY_DN4891_c0_g1_i1.p1 TRINITY_DN4891_c0_g1~~TRINITY_DN4891_c0_g1_i1.p1  ORF type:complete len:150 (-),score=22.17 TRINITY_DN4891_c0_g1_i1:135-584(-)
MCVFQGKRKEGRGGAALVGLNVQLKHVGGRYRLQYLNRKRSGWECWHMFMQIYKVGLKGYHREWTQDEVLEVVRMREDEGLNWFEIGERTASRPWQCLAQYQIHRINSAGPVSWTNEEVKLLKEYGHHCTLTRPTFPDANSRLVLIYAG